MKRGSNAVRSHPAETELADIFVLRKRMHTNHPLPKSERREEAEHESPFTVWHKTNIPHLVRVWFTP